MRCICTIVIVCLICLSSVASFATEKAKEQSLACPRSIAVDVTIVTQGQISGWDAIPAKSTFTLAIKENAIQNESLICHYTDGTVQYNLAKTFPKNKKCFLGPNQSFICH
jgi:phosphoribosylformimino-5-aminoimidazole carboxamide ribonucleotide (ProFAR) isomerase